MTLKIPFFETGLGVEALIINGKIPTLTDAQSREYAFLFTLFNNCVTYDPTKRWSALEALSHVQTLKDIVGVYLRAEVRIVAKAFVTDGRP